MKHRVDWFFPKIVTVQPRHSEDRTDVLTAAAPLFSSYTGAQPIAELFIANIYFSLLLNSEAMLLHVLI